MNDEKQTVISVLRAIIISSPHRGKSIRDLSRDYCEIEGVRQVPIFEYRKIEDFLRASGEFILESAHGELIVHERPNSESLHISKFIAGQNKPRRRSLSANKIQRFVRRPQISFVRNSQFSGTKSVSKSIFNKKISNNTTSAYRAQVPIHQRHPTVEYSLEQLKGMATNCVQDRLPIVNTQRPSSSNNGQTIGQPIQPYDLRNRLNEARSITKTNALAPKKPELIDLTTDEWNSPKVSNRQKSCHDDRLTKEYQPNTSTISNNSMRSDARFIKDASCEQKNEVKRMAAPSSAPVTTSNDVKPVSALPSLMSAPIHPSNPFFDFSLPPPLLQTSQLTSRIQDRLINPPKYNTHSIVNTNVVCSNVKKSTVNDRLVQARQRQSTVQSDTSKDSSDFNRNETTPSPQSRLRQPFQSKVPSHSTNLVNNETSEEIKALFRYCADHNLSEPKFKIFKVKPINRLQCHVTVNDIRYSTYPTDYGNENEAKSETAKYSLERLVAINNLLKYPVCLDEEAEVAVKIYNCIKDCPTGVFSKKIPEKFQTEYQESLPVDWMRVVQNYPRFFTVDDCINDQIVYIVEEGGPDELLSEYRNMDKLILPWNDDYWCVIITCTNSTVEIWGRLIGKEYSQLMDTLIIDIEMDLMTNKVVAKEFNVGQIYLVLISECGYRVRIEKVDNVHKKCLCFFIDEGDQRLFNMNEIYVCQSKFAKFPAQAIRFALHGLDDFAENEFARPHLESVLLNRSLIGQIFTKQEDFVQLEESDDLEAIVQVVFYDTSTDDDINLHPIIVEKICADIPAPKLQPTKLTPVYISHIADNGDIFCQLQVNGVHYVNKLIRKLTQYSNSVPFALQVNGNTDKKLFLVFDEDTSLWCRGSLVQEGTDSNIMFFIDYGKTKSVPLTKIYRLESLSPALLTFPPQAIQTKLYGIDEPESIVSTLRGYFSADTLAYMKVQTVSNVPEVKLYLNKDKLIICINDSFTLEKECLRVIADEQKTELLPTFNNLKIGNVKLPSKKLSKLQKFKPPQLEACFEVAVVMASNPGNFVIRPNQLMPQWVKLMKDLQEYCKKSSYTVEANMIEMGEAYACLHSDGSWYRGIVELHRQSKIIIYFCDLGEIDNIDDIKKLKILPEEYRALPKLAMTAKLSGIKPISKDWDMDDCILFNRLTVGKLFQSFVEKITDNENSGDNSLLELRLIDVSLDYDVCINDSFVSNERAIRI